LRKAVGLLVGLVVVALLLVGTSDAQDHKGPAAFIPDGGYLVVGNFESFSARHNNARLSGIWSTEIPLGPVAGMTDVSAACNFDFFDGNEPDAVGDGRMRCRGTIGRETLVKGSARFRRRYTSLSVNNIIDLSSYGPTDIFSCRCQIAARTRVAKDTFAQFEVVLELVERSQ
jgi:hypothetical protein